MIVTFVICEGPHDAYFVGRLISQTAAFVINEDKLNQYPKELQDFILQRLQKESAEEIRLGKFSNPTIPICSYRKEGHMVLPISVGGMTQLKNAKVLISEIITSYDKDVLTVSGSVIKQIRIAFVYDADSRGVEATKSFFIEHFSALFGTFSSEITTGVWIENERNVPISIFIFTDEGKDSGTLEDSLVGLFENKNKPLIDEVRKLINNNFEIKNEQADDVAYEAKKNKAILTTCGQLEKKNAGSALSVVIRDTKLLDNVFNDADRPTPWRQLGQLFIVDEA